VPGDDVQVGVEDTLAGCFSAVPADVIGLRGVFLVEMGFGVV